MLYVWTVEAFVRRGRGCGIAPFARDVRAFTGPVEAKAFYNERAEALRKRHQPGSPVQYVYMRRHRIGDVPAPILLVSALRWPADLSAPEWAARTDELAKVTDMQIIGSTSGVSSYTRSDGDEPRGSDGHDDL